LLESFITKGKEVDRMVAQSGNPILVQEYKLLVAMEPKVLSNVIATCRAALNLFANPEIQKMTSYNSIDFVDFRKKKIVLYIQNKIHDIQFYSCLTSIFAEQLFGALMSKLPEKKDNQVFFLIDEFSSLYLPSIMVALSNLRKFDCGIMLVIQDYSQLCHIYGNNQAQAIRSNTYIQIYFGNQPLAVCKDLEQMAGRQEIEEENGRTNTKPLISAEHIRRLPKNHALVFMGNNLPIYAKMKPYYKHWIYNGYTKLPTPSFISQCPFEIVPIPKI
jgi:type IV secretory pathway TraG/TraD family ATPase VirD4